MLSLSFFFFFNDTATTEIYTLSLHDALPISNAGFARAPRCAIPRRRGCSTCPTRAAGSRPRRPRHRKPGRGRSEEHTSELQSLAYLVCRLLLEKKKKKNKKK